MNSWEESIIEKVDLKLEGIRDKEIRFFRLEEFKRNIKRVDSFSKKCNFCENEKKSITELIESLDEAINVPGKSRRAYDKLISRLSRHIQKEHGFYAPYYFSYHYSFYGIVVGLILGFVMANVWMDFELEMVLVGFVIGLLPAYVLGFIKDGKIRSQKRLL